MTLRDRDTLAQDRVAIDELADELERRVSRAFRDFPDAGAAVRLHDGRTP